MRKRARRQLHRDGTWRHLWRISEYANISIFDVESPDKFGEILMSLPLFAFMQIKVTPLCRHPSAIASDGD
jgi:muconolactone D-isomerase